MSDKSPRPAKKVEKVTTTQTETEPVEVAAEADGATTAAPAKKNRHLGRWLTLAAILVAGALVTIGILGLLMNIFQKKQEAKDPWFRVAEQTETTYDPAVWGQNFPLQYEGWKKTNEMAAEDQVKRDATPDDPRTIVTHSKIEKDPRLVTMWKGYAFSIDYREPRGHAYMLEDQRLTKRVTSPQFKQPGACLNCHASTVKIYRDLGNGDMNKGFDAMNKMTYQDATKLAEHPVACIDCHDPKTMQLRVTRPAFINGMRALKEGQGIKDYDVNKQASAQEMRAYVCAQCHVEYYFKGEGKTLTFPWNNGLTIDDELKYYDETAGFTDFKHGTTGANIVKAQHPDFETWSNGIHAKAGVTCADCHMPYTRDGAMKYSDHQVRSPMMNDAQINKTCLTCHHETEAEMKSRVEDIHNRYEHSKDVSFNAFDALVKDLEKAVKDGNVPQDRIDKARAYQRKASFFMDYVVSENSRGFHAPAYTQRILNDVTDASRLGQLALQGVNVDNGTKPSYPKANASAPATQSPQPTSPVTGTPAPSTQTPVQPSTAPTSSR